MVDLNTLIDPLSGWDLHLGMGINDAGQITGTGVLGGVDHAFLLTPVPERSIPPIVGDLNRDGQVDASDAQAMLSALTNLDVYKANMRLTDAEVLAIGDIDRDGKFTNADLQSLLTMLKSGGGSQTIVPEPSPVKLMIVALVILALGKSVDGIKRRASPSLQITPAAHGNLDCLRGRIMRGLDLALRRHQHEQSARPVASAACFANGKAG